MKKELFVKDIPEAGSPFVEVFLVASAKPGEKRGGGKYLSLVLQDRTGSIDAKRWEWDGNTQYAAGQFIKIEAEPGKYNGKPQLKILRMCALSDEEVCVDDFLPACARDRGDQVEDIAAIVRADIANESVQRIVRRMLEKCWGQYRDAPAAKTNHQAYLGGLAEHALNLCKLAKAVCGIYPALDRDLLLAAAIVHDIGKVDELSFQRAIDYTRRGRFVGHVGIGLQMFHAELPGWYWDDPRGWSDEQIADREKLDHLEHIIASHHGMKEWGALQIPLSREAHVFHQLDMIEAKLGIYDAMPGDRDGNGFGTYSGVLGGYPYLGVKQ